MASGLALRNVLRRTKTTAIIGAIQGVTRPENLRMVNLLDIHVEPITPESLKEYDRIAMVDVQPHYFGGLIDRVDLVIDHHPEQPGYTAVFKDIRADYGSTSHDPHRAPARGGREHLRAHRDGDALRDQVGHAVLQPPDQPRRPRGVLVSLSARRRRADPQDGGRGNHARAARLRAEGAPRRHARRPGLLRVPRAARRARTSSPTSPTSSCSSRTSSGRSSPASSTTRWSCRCGTSATSKNAGEFVRRFFADIGSAGGHRAMAKAVVPMRAFREKFGDLGGEDIGAQLQALVHEFLAHERSKSEVRSQKSEVRRPKMKP